LLTYPCTGYYAGREKHTPEINKEIKDYDETEVVKVDFRVVISLTTMPDDIIGLNQTLSSILNQSFTPNAIYVNVPYISRRSGQEYVIPDFLHKMTSISILRGNDYGPLSKIVGTLKVETDPTTLIVSVDDDKLYTSNFLNKLVYHAQLDDRVAWGICGWGFLPWFQPYGVIPAYPSYYTRGIYGRSVQVLQGVCGTAYRRKFFSEIEDVFSKNIPECFTQDDMWISGYLNSKGIRRILAPGRLTDHWNVEPIDSGWLRQKIRKYRLSDTNSRPGQDQVCKTAIEEHFNMPWEL
jgi:hypothetical protein